MGRLRVNAFSVSLDGYAAGPGQSLEQPMGEGGMALHEWAFGTRTFRRMFGMGEDGGTGVDDGFAQRSFHNLGAWVLGRNMFGPVRGPWPDDSWRGWWGDEPPYHVPVFVLTHHAREPLEMQGGTVFHFVTGGLEEALERAHAAAGERDVRLGGGTSVVRQALQRRLVNDMHLVVSPVLLGRGEALYAGLDLPALGYRVTERVQGEVPLHVVMQRG